MKPEDRAHTPDREFALGESLPGGGLSGLERDAVAVWRRYMELPRYLRTVRGRDELAETLGEVSRELGFTRLCLVSGPTVTRELATGLGAMLDPTCVGPVQVHDNSDAQIEALSGAPEVGAADALVAMGGGRTIDVAKSVCDLIDTPVVVVPTQLTADGIASPVSVIRAHGGEVESRRARLPIGVVVDLDLVAGSPPETVRAGLGDLLANPSAVRDWFRAADAGREPVDDFAALLAEAASSLVYGTDVSSLGRNDLEPGFLHRLLRGLVLSGLAMEIAGSSRPCSGSEHLISHAIDRLHPGTARHGEQVAFGTLISTRLQGQDWRGLRSFMVAAGMERAAAGFGLSQQALVEVVRAAPSTRPGRYTVLDEVEFGGDLLAAMVEEVLAA